MENKNMSHKGLLKGGEEKEDLNNQDSIEEQEKEGEMTKKKSSSRKCPSGTTKSKSGNTCRKTKRAKTSSRKIRRS